MIAVRSIGSALAMCGLALGIVACKNVALEEAAGPVRRLGVQEAPPCERLGTTHVQVTSKVLFFDRDDAKVAEELTTLARNSAARMGGNVVVAEGGVRDGKQTFGVYRCPEE